MMVSKCIEIYKPENTTICYKLLQNNVVGMGLNDGIHSFSIFKIHMGETNQIIKKICHNVKNKNAIDLIWNDVKSGNQK